MRGIVDFDLETTGPSDPDCDRDRIVEFSFRFWGGTGLKTWTELVNPGEEFLPIPEERTEVHGIHTDDVRGLPEFEAYAERVQQVVNGATLCGYGSRGYDVPILDRELRRAGQQGLQRDGPFITHPEADLLELWKRHERRDLATADRRFGSGQLTEEDAHSAEADAACLAEVRAGMLREFAPHVLDLAPGPAYAARLAELARPEGAMDRAGCFRRRDDGTVVFAFSKHRGKPVRQEPGMLEWILGKDFPEETKRVARHLLDRIRR